MTGIEVLKRVRYDLLEIGWIQGVTGNPQTGMCVGGWLLHTAGGCNYTWRDAYLALRAVSKTKHSLPTINDEPGRTLEEVVAWVDRAIAYLEATSVEETLTPALA